MKDETGPEFRKLMARYEAIRAAGGDMAFTLGDDPGSLEEVAAVANAMLDYVPPGAAGSLHCNWCGENVAGPCNHPGDPCGLYGDPAS